MHTDDDKLVPSRNLGDDASPLGSLLNDDALETSISLFTNLFVVLRMAATSLRARLSACNCLTSFGSSDKDAKRGWQTALPSVAGRIGVSSVGRGVGVAGRSCDGGVAGPVLEGEGSRAGRIGVGGRSCIGAGMIGMAGRSCDGGVAGPVLEGEGCRAGRIGVGGRCGKDDRPWSNASGTSSSESSSLDDSASNLRFGAVKKKMKKKIHFNNNNNNNIWTYIAHVSTN